jgi:beta-glucosidase
VNSRCRRRAKAITLLKNENALLPLNPAKLKTIAVIGPNANRALLGGYSGVPSHPVTVLDGIQARLGDQVKVLHAEGCQITVGGSWNQDAVTPADPAADARQIAEAVGVAKKSDVVILAIGDNEQTSREAWARNHMGDRASLDLFGRQEALLEALLATGKPVVVLLFNGRPHCHQSCRATCARDFGMLVSRSGAGQAVAEVLFGDHNPGGKLPISIPRSAGHLPAFYNYKPSARRGYLLDEVSPLFAFGYGLSYTKFRFTHLRLAQKKISRRGSTQVLVEVTNTGNRAGTEVVQLYLRDCVSSVTRPVKELKGFRKIALAPGETQTVALAITPESLAFWNVAMKYVVEPGEFLVMVGSSSRDEDLQKTILTVVK